MMKEAPVFLHFNVPGLPEEAQIIVTYSWVAMAILIGLALAARFSLKKTAPTGVQNLLETIVEGLENFVVDIMGTEGTHYLSLIGSLFLFILVCNLAGAHPRLRFTHREH